MDVNVFGYQVIYFQKCFYNEVGICANDVPLRQLRLNFHKRRNDVELSQHAQCGKFIRKYIKDNFRETFSLLASFSELNLPEIALCQ